MKFIAQHYSLPARRLSRNATAALVRAAELALYDSARDLLEDARQQAAWIVEQARDEADAEIATLRRREQASRDERDAEEEQRHWSRAHQLEAHYQALRQQLTEALEPLLDQALTQALQQIALSVDAVSRLRAVAAALEQGMPNPAGATLWVSSMDAGLLPALGELPWALEISADLPAGHCSLVGVAGAWQCDFETMLARVLA